MSRRPTPPKCQNLDTVRAEPQYAVRRLSYFSTGKWKGGRKGGNEKNRASKVITGPVR